MLVFFTKLGFIVFMVRFFFLLNHFLAVEDYELSKSTRHSPWNTKEFYLDQSFFSDTIVSLMILCVRLPSKLMILLPTHDVTKHLTCRNKMIQPLNCNWILQIKIVRNFSIFHKLLFDFEVSRFIT